MVEFQRLVDSLGGHWIGGGGHPIIYPRTPATGILGRCTAVTMAVTPSPSLALCRRGAVTGQPLAVPPPSTRRCTLDMVVTKPPTAALGLGLVGTALGVAVSLDRQWWCPTQGTSQLLPLGLHVGTALGVAVPPRQHPEPGFTSTSSPTSSPLQMC
jgi:hypothetical protein